MPPEDWGRILAVLAHFYGFRPWEVERLTEAQVEMYLSNVGYIRFLRDLATLQYSYSKLDDEAVGKMLETASRPPDPNSLRARGWRHFVQAYNALDDEEAREATVQAQRLPIRPETAEAIVQWVEFGEMSRGPDGARVWREDIFPLWNSLVATAAPANQA